GLTVRLLAVAVGVSLVVDGVLRLAAAARRGVPGEDRVADAAFGLTGTVFGVLALVWPDITAPAVAVVLGARVLMTGLSLGWAAVRRRTSRPDRRRGRRTRAGAAVLSAAVAAGAVVVS